MFSLKSLRKETIFVTEVFRKRCRPALKNGISRNIKKFYKIITDILEALPKGEKLSFYINGGQSAKHLYTTNDRQQLRAGRQMKCH
jgi:hypothetical protein